MKTKIVEMGRTWWLVVMLCMLYGMLYGQRTYSVVYPFGPEVGEDGRWRMEVREDSGWLYVRMSGVEFSEADVLHGREEVMAVFGPNGRLVYLTADAGLIGSVMGGDERLEEVVEERVEELQSRELEDRMREQLRGEGIEISGYRGLRGGGYIACGGEEEVEEVGDGGEGYGVLARYDDGGRLLWYRRYGWRKASGSYGGEGWTRGRLEEVYELEDGRMMALGVVYGEGEQGRRGGLWVLVTDGEGCVEGAGCGNGVVRPPSSERRGSSLIDVGAKWYYEYHDSFHKQVVGYDLYEIEDTLLVYGLVSFQVLYQKKHSDIDRDTLRENYRYAMWIEDGTRVFVHNPNLIAYELYYDFDNDSMYYVWYYVEGRDLVKGSRKVTVDSVVVKELNGNPVEIQYCDRVRGFLFARAENWEVIKGIGGYKYGLIPSIGSIIGRAHKVPLLRCFSVDTMHYQFVDYPCDATWDIITSSTMPHSERYRLYPNPHFGEVKVEGFSPGARYRLYDVHGRLLGRGRLVEGIIEVPYSGVVLLEIRDAKEVWHKKLVGMVAAD